jgi:hypothetical protein
MTLGIILIIGIEIKCGMIGLGVIQAGIHGVNLIDGHHLDMIDGDITCIMVGITTDGIMDGIMDSIIKDGRIGIIMCMAHRIGDQIDKILHT